MTATNQVLHQAGVIAYRILDGKIQVLLMTSRDTGRWIIPKGNVNGRSTPLKVAAREAYEEAGVKGTITSSIPLGFYTYFKKLGSGEARAATVEVYVLRVKQRLKKWPEKSERKLFWVSTKKAIRLVQEPGVVPLLLRLMELEDSLAKPPPATPRSKTEIGGPRVIDTKMPATRPATDTNGGAVGHPDAAAKAREPTSE
jgi:8-oxo-dGTP pyrophosphatase MutT (NUDIX family)